MSQAAKKQLKNIPKSPGVYQFFDQNGDLLYIGKAKVLKSRISSYFRVSGDSRPLISQMVTQIARIETLVTESEIDALILESELIRKLLPKYNVKLRDDKTFLMVKITKEEFPRVFFTRYKDYDKKDKSAEYFGPYPSGDALRQAFKALRKIFLFADCTDVKYRSYQKRGRPCLFGMIRNCLSPCVGRVDSKIYLKEIRYLKAFLKGKKKKLIEGLGREMVQAAKKEDFERAANLRNKLEGIKHLNRVAVIASDNQATKFNFARIEAYDISNISGTLPVGSMAVVEDGLLKKSEYRKFEIKTVFGPNDPAMIAEILKRRFGNNWPRPNLIVIDGGPAQFFAAKKVLNKLNIKIPVLAIAKGPKRKRDDFIYDHPGLAKILKKDDNLVRLIKLCRDEAHRFAVSYFHKRQIKNLFNKE